MSTKYDPFAGVSAAEEQEAMDWVSGFANAALDEATLWDMELRHLYTLMSKDIGDIDLSKHCNASRNVFLDVQDAVNLYADVYDTYGEFPALDGAKALQEYTLSKFADTVSRTTFHYDVFAFSDDEDVVKNQNASAYKAKLLTNDVKPIQEKLQHCVDDCEAGMKDASAHPENLAFDEILPMRLDMQQPITKSDIHLINNKIQGEVDGIAKDAMYWESRSEYHKQMASDIQYAFDNYSDFDVDESIPEYYRQFLSGSYDAVDKIRHEQGLGSGLQTKAQELTEQRTKELFQRVYDTADYCRSHAVPEALLPKNARGVHENPNVLTKETRECLGAEYEAFEAEQFDKTLTAMKARHVSKGLLGIDVSKSAVQMEPKVREVTVSKEQVKATQAALAGKASTQAALSEKAAPKLRDASEFDSIVKASKQQVQEKGLGES